MVSQVKFLSTIVSSLGLVLVLFLLSILPTGQRSSTPIETIQGIEYAKQATVIHITEPLAHFDVQLREPVFAKSLHLQFKYRPGTAQELAVGVRQNSFWLSYPLHTFYQVKANTTASTDWRTATVTIPITTALQDTNRTIDVMLVADAQTDLIATATQTNPTTNWELQDMTATVTYTRPPVREIKQYVKSILNKERAL